MRYVVLRVKTWMAWLPALIVAGAFWDAHRSDVAFVDVFFAAGGGLLLGALLILRAFVDSLDRLERMAEAEADSAYKVGIAEERERVASIVDVWKPYAGVFANYDLANFIRRGDDLS
jgi:hypothetical protein